MSSDVIYRATSSHLRDPQFSNFGVEFGLKWANTCLFYYHFPQQRMELIKDDILTSIHHPYHR